jgi:serine/threonine-protein phosphatase 6 regulatory subunit 3
MQAGPMQTTVGEIIPLTVERFRICELYAELLHCSSLSLLNRPPGYGPVYDGEGRLTGGLSGLEELARVISANGSEPQEPETPPAPSSRSFTQDTESPVASRGTLSSSLASDDTGFGENESGSEANSDDLGHLEEIDVHDEPSVELRIPHSPQPSREPLPPAPFAVPSPRSQLPQLPDVSEDAEGAPPALSSIARDNRPSSPSSTSTASASSFPETVDADPIDIDPFADPHDSPTDARPPDPDPPLLASAISTSLEDSRELRAGFEDSTTPSMWDAPKTELLAPAGELFKDQMLSLGILNTMLVCQSATPGSIVIAHQTWYFSYTGSFLRIPYEQLFAQRCV